MVKALIIEDEPRSKLVLKNFIKNYCEGINVIGDTETVKDAIALIKNKKPALVFLDVELKDGKGLEVLDYFKAQQFVTILVTGYDHYAIDAIKKSASGYILKPIVIKELVAAVEKAKKKITELTLLNNLKSVKSTKQNSDGKIIVKNNKEQVKVIDPQDILYIEAQNQYTKWHLRDASTIIQRNSLSKYKDILPTSFFQIHRSYIVNLNLVTSCDNGRGGFLELDTIKLPVSYRRKKELLLQLKMLTTE